MSTTTFMSISRKECRKVYKEMLKNSDVKWESGIKLAEIKDFGGAISFEIISIEELIKSLIVFFDGIGFNFRSIRGINTLFENHQIRYVIAYAMFVMGSFGEDIVKLISKLRNDPKQIDHIISYYKNNRTDSERVMLNYLEKKIQILIAEFEWFSKIDLFRQKGFYCDYENQLINPIEISEDDYIQVVARLKRVRVIGKSTIEAINDESLNLKEHLDQFKSNLKKYKVYEDISKSLAHMKIKESPFDSIRRNILENTSREDIIKNIKTTIKENK